MDGSSASRFPTRGFHPWTLGFASGESLSAVQLGHAADVSSLFHGTIDDVRVYGPALNESEVKTLCGKPNGGL